VKSAVRAALQSGLRALGLPGAAWRLGLAEERWFWNEYFRTRGLHWPEEYRARLDLDAPFPEHLERLVADVAGTPRVLDVGSGPLTAVGLRREAGDLELVAVDPLADWYAVLYERYGVRPRVRPTVGGGETVAERFPADSFDLVHARNCIDHSADPLRAIDQMLQVVKPGRCVYLEHAVDEGRNEGYRGLHQWNFCARDGRFHVGGRRGSTDVVARLGDRAEVTTEVGADQWIRVVLRRHHRSR